MKIVWKVLCIIVALSFLANLIIMGRFILLGLILTALFGYLGWRDSSPAKSQGNVNEKQG
jgi:hypothetical protein